MGLTGLVGKKVDVVLYGLLQTVDWNHVRSAMGGSGFVPESLKRLNQAKTDEEANEAYWTLDNRVVVQGQLFDAARWVVGPLVSTLQAGVAAPARRRVVDLLVEIALGVPHQSELQAGNEQLGEACRQQLKLGLWCFYGLLNDHDARVRIGAIDILEALEVDQPRLGAVMSELRDRDSDPAVRLRAAEVQANPAGG